MLKYFILAIQAIIHFIINFILVIPFILHSIYVPLLAFNLLILPFFIIILHPYFFLLIN